MHVLSFSPRHVEKKMKRIKLRIKMATLLFAWFAHFDVSNERIKSSHYQILCNACDTNGNIITSAYKEVRQCSYTCKCYARLHTRAPTSHLDQSRFALYFVAIREAMAVIVGSILCILNSFFPHLLRFYLQICVSRIDLLPQYPVTADTFQIVLYRNHYAPLYLY